VKTELRRKLWRHALYLRRPGSRFAQRADLSYANLSYADLSYADLSYADLSYANLSCAILRYANLSYANLSYADLIDADLSYANLSCANLRGTGLILLQAEQYTAYIQREQITIGCTTFDPSGLFANGIGEEADESDRELWERYRPVILAAWESLEVSE